MQVLLMCFVMMAQANEPIALELSAVEIMPAMPSLPLGTPAPIVNADGSTTLPPDLAQAVARIFQLCKRYPDLAQAHMDAALSIERQTCDSKLAVQLAHAQTAAVKTVIKKEAMRPWLIATIAIASAAVGGLVGLTAGLVVKR